MPFICNALYATAFPTLREKNPAAFLAHIYRRWLLAPFLLGFIHEGAVLCLSSCFCLPFSCQVGLYRCQSKNKTNPKGEKQKNGNTPAEEKAANSHILKTCDGKYGCSIQFDHKPHTFVNFFHPDLRLLWSSYLIVCTLDPVYDTFITLFVCVLTPVWEGDMHNFLLVARATSYWETNVSWRALSVLCLRWEMVPRMLLGVKL